MSKKIFGSLFFAIGIILEIFGLIGIILEILGSIGIILESLDFINNVSSGFFLIFIGIFLIILGLSMIVIGDGEDGYSPKEKVSKSFFDDETKENL